MAEAIRLYTDGSCDNPGPGGWGVLISHPSKELALSGFHPDQTTSQAMELTAAIKGLEALKRPARVEIHTDSQYLITVASPERIARANRELVRELRALLKRHSVEFIKVAAHTGDPGNERAHELANGARQDGIEGAREWLERSHLEPEPVQNRFRDWFAGDPVRELYPWLYQREDGRDAPRVRTPAGEGILRNLIGGHGQVSLDGQRDTESARGRKYPPMREFRVEDIEPIPFTKVQGHVA